MYSIPITIADVLIEVSSPLSAVELGIEKWLGPFFRATDDPSARVSLRWAESISTPALHGEMIYNPGSIWKMYRAGQEYYAAIAYQEENTSASASSVLRANAAWDDLTLTEQRTGAQWTSLLNIGASELILRTKILFADGLVFHASGIDDNGRGIVFVGHSGAGKSTQAGLWSTLSGVIAMNDDRIAVRVNSNRVTCYDTPWGGDKDIARNHQAPLFAIILLEQAQENKIRLLSPSTAAPLLLARSFLPYWNETLMQRAFTNLNTILARVPVYCLRCRPEMATIPLVRAVL